MPVYPLKLYWHIFMRIAFLLVSTVKRDVCTDNESHSFIHIIVYIMHTYA